MKPLILVLLLLSASVFASARLRASPPGQSPSTVQTPTRASTARELPSKHSGLPTAGEFNTIESPQAHEHRQAREKHYGHLLPHPVSDPGKLLNGLQEDVDMTFIDHVYVQKTGTELAVAEPHGIPVSASNAIVVGTILSGKSYMNGDHDYVYSDYQVRVDEVLKQDAAANLVIGQQIVAARAGGVIQFPSGHVTNFLIQGHGLPKVGSQYVLFLVRTIPDFPEYRIAYPSSYELSNGQVFPLDDATAEYDGLAASAFLNVTGEAIKAAKGAKP